MNQSRLDSEADAKALRIALFSSDEVATVRLTERLEQLSWPIQISLNWSDRYGDLMPPSEFLMAILGRELAHNAFLLCKELRDQ
jgi:hypothetical protein